MTQQKPEEKFALAGIVAAIAVGYFTHWSIGVIIAFMVLYKVGKAQQQETPEKSPTKPFLSAIGNTFKLPDCYESKQEIKAIACDLEAHSNYDHEVVGESNYRTSIWASIPSAHSADDRFRLYFIFTLNQEDDNEHDKNAVAVQLKGVVGYLPRAMAKKYRAWAAKHDIGASATCRGVIVGNKGKDYSIWLDLPI